jgi:hypothetical protein
MSLGNAHGAGWPEVRFFSTREPVSPKPPAFLHLSRLTD